MKSFYPFDPRIDSHRRVVEQAAISAWEFNAEVRYVLSEAMRDAGLAGFDAAYAYAMKFLRGYVAIHDPEPFEMI